MAFRTALKSAAPCTASRLALIVPAALAMVLVPSLFASTDASAQGFRNSGSFGGFGRASPRFNMPVRPSGRFATIPNRESGKTRPHPRPRPDRVVDTRYPTDQHRPRPPRRPGRPPIVRPGGGVHIAIPAGTPPVVVPPSTPSRPSAGRPGGGGAVPPAVNERRYVPDEVLIEIAANTSPQALAALARRHRLTSLQSFNLQLTGTSFQRLRIKGRRTVPQVVRALEADRLVVAVQPNYIATLQEMAAPVSFPVELTPYAPLRMRLEEAHRLATGNRIMIGVIDGGVDLRHPELAGLIVSTFDAIGSGDAAHPHGTSIVGAIAARVRLRGTAPGAHILVARAFGANRGGNDGTSVSILRALDWVVASGARVINMSFAGPHDPAIERQLAAARRRGIVLVAAVGNAGPNAAPLYPAALAGVIAVTATDENDRIFRAANRGRHVTIAAPGVDLWLPTVDRGYRMTSGTSFAAAEVSGLIALMLELNPSLTPDAVLRALVSTARDLGAPGTDPLFGAGLIDAYQALLAVGGAAPAVAERPRPEAPAPADRPAGTAAPTTAGLGGAE